MKWENGCPYSHSGSPAQCRSSASISLLSNITFSESGSSESEMSSPFKGEEFVVADESIPCAEGHTRFTCMSRKRKFDTPHPKISLMKNGRYYMRTACPWLAKDGRPLTACKFASKAAYDKQQAEAKEAEAMSDGSSSASASQE